MKRRFKKIGAIIALSMLLPLLFTLTASAKERDYVKEFSVILPPEISDAMESEGGISSALSAEALFNIAFSAVSSERGAIISFFALCIGSVVIFALASALFGEISDSVQKGLSVLFCASLFAALLPVLRTANSSLARAGELFSAGAPIMCAITLAGGGSASAAAALSGASLTLSFISLLTTKILPILATVGFASSLLRTLGGSAALERGAKNLYNRILGIAVFILTATLSLQSVIASAEDSAALRAARYGTSTIIPSVGGAVSSSLSVLLGGLSYAKSIVGAAAIGALLYILIAPMVILFLYKIGIGIAEALAEILGAKNSFSLSAFSSVIDSVIASWALSGVMLVLQVVLFMKGGAVA